MTALATYCSVRGEIPFGLATARALATYGVRTRAVTHWNWVANPPRAHITNQCTLEVLRDLGVESEVDFRKRIGLGVPSTT